MNDLLGQPGFCSNRTVHWPYRRTWKHHGAGYGVESPLPLSDRVYLAPVLKSSPFCCGWCVAAGSCLVAYKGVHRLAWNRLIRTTLRNLPGTPSMKEAIDD